MTGGILKLSGNILINLFLFPPIYPLLFCSRSFYLSKVFKVGSAIFTMIIEIENAIMIVKNVKVSPWWLILWALVINTKNQFS